MPRTARKKSKTSIYHVMARGINRQDIFHDDEDRHKYLETLKRIGEESGSEVLGYCLMNNHVHLVIREPKRHIAPYEAFNLQRMSLMERREAIQQFKGIEGLSIRQIVRITGLTYHEVYNA